MESIISLRELSFKYEDRWILENINLDIPKGGFVAVLGPNGSGKSTLLKNICRGLKPQKGSVLVAGKDIKYLKVKEIAREIAIVHQHANMNFGLTCKEIVLMGRYAYQSTWKWKNIDDENIAKECMEYCGVWQFRNKSITELSGGEFQRVMIAKALAQQTEILLMDEPVASLDLKFQVEILNLCRTLTREKGVTIVAPIHDINLARQFADMTLILDRGKVARFGKSCDVITKDNIEQLYGVKVRELKDEYGGVHYFPTV